MNKFLVAAAALAMTATSAFANSYTVNANVTSVTPLTSTVSESVPQEVCNQVRVPVYETRRGQASTGDALGGAIIGGIIGNQFGSGSGKDAMTVLGAIVGADVANKRGGNYQVVTGYRNETQCSVQYVAQQRVVSSGYEVGYEWNGLRGSIITNTQYRVGDEILVNVSIN